MDGKTIRLSKLFPNGGNAVVAAMDHGQAFGPVEGLVDFTAAAERLRDADAVLMSPHMIRHSGLLYQGKGSPVAIARLNWNSIHCEPWGYREAWAVQASSARSAVIAGADVVLGSLVLMTGSESHDAENVRGFAALAEECSALGIPLIGEVFPVGGLRGRPADFHDYIKRASRIICELGADAIKTFFTGEHFAEITEAVPIPVFGLGAEKTPSALDALRLADALVRAGARGVIFGRNVFQDKNPPAFLAALKVVVQGLGAPADAMAACGLV